MRLTSWSFRADRRWASPRHWRTGAASDLARATRRARRMVCRYGMSERIGPVYLEENAGGEVFLGRDWMGRRSYSEEKSAEMSRNPIDLPTSLGLLGEGADDRREASGNISGSRWDTNSLISSSERADCRLDALESFADFRRHGQLVSRLGELDPSVACLALSRVRSRVTYGQSHLLKIHRRLDSYSCTWVVNVAVNRLASNSHHGRCGRKVA